MSKNPRCKAVLLVLALAAAAAVVAPAAMATPITYNFTVNVNQGPLAGAVENGSLSYDSSSVVPGRWNNATGLLTALAFTFNGTAYNAGTANTGSLGFDGSGALTYFVFGNNCFTGSCAVTPGTNQWWVSPGTGGTAGFVYSLPGLGNFEGNVSYALASVPEPGALGLFGFGLLLLGVVARRRLTLRRAG
jgi:hypothetical protein